MTSRVENVSVTVLRQLLSASSRVAIWVASISSETFYDEKNYVEVDSFFGSVDLMMSSKYWLTCLIW